MEPPRFLSGRGIKGDDHITAGRSANGSDHNLAPGDQRPAGQAEAVFAIANLLIPDNLAVFDVERPNRPRQSHFHRGQTSEKLHLLWSILASKVRGIIAL